MTRNDYFRAAICSVVAVASLVAMAAAQEEWRPLPLTRVDAPRDSAAAGLTLTAAPGALEILLAFDNSCQTKSGASYQARGAVVKIRLTGPPVGRSCPGAPATEVDRARLTGLKPKRYQVVVLTEDRQGHWRPWKAGVVEVP